MKSEKADDSDLIMPGGYITIRVYLDEGLEPCHKDLLLDDFMNDLKSSWKIGIEG